MKGMPTSEKSKKIAHVGHLRADIEQVVTGWCNSHCKSVMQIALDFIQHIPSGTPQKDGA